MKIHKNDNNIYHINILHDTIDWPKKQTMYFTRSMLISALIKIFQEVKNILCICMLSLCYHVYADETPQLLYSDGTNIII